MRFWKSFVKLKHSVSVVPLSLTAMLFHCSSPPEPTSVDIHVDGINDICTKGGDINFVFTGFSVNGKVRFLYVYLFHLMLILSSEKHLPLLVIFIHLCTVFILTGSQQRSVIRSCWSPGCTEKRWQ